MKDLEGLMKLLARLFLIYVFNIFKSIRLGL